MGRGGGNLADTQNPVYVDSSTVHGDGTKEHPLSASGGGGSPGGPDTAVQFNNAGAFGGDARFVFDPGTGDLTYSDLVHGPTVAIQTGGTNGNVFLEGGDTNQITLQVNDGFNSLALGNQEPVAGAGISIINANSSGAGGGISIQDNDTAGGAGLALSSASNVVSLSSPSASMILVAGGAGGNFLKLQKTGGGQIQIFGDNVTPVAIHIGFSGDTIGFFNHVPSAKPTVTGSRGGNAALASLLTALDGLGLITDSTTP